VREHGADRAAGLTVWVNMNLDFVGWALRASDMYLLLMRTVRFEGCSGSLMVTGTDHRVRVCSLMRFMPVGMGL